MKFEIRHASKMKQFKTALSCLLFLIPVILMILPAQLAAASLSQEIPGRESDAFRIEYLEDKSGSLTFEQVQSNHLSGSFKPYSGSTITEGLSRSTWWFRIRLEDKEPTDSARYISVNNALVEKIVLYQPYTTQDRSGYTVSKSGWYYRGQTGDEGFIYPVFKIPPVPDSNPECFVQIKATCTKNYTLQILSPRQFGQTNLQSLIFLGVEFGILLAMMLYNLVIFLFLRNRTYLYYVIYLFSMLLYQSVLLGMFKLLNHQLAEVLLTYIPVLGIFTLITLLVFVRSFLNTASNIPRHDRALKLLLFMSILVIGMMVCGWMFEANIMSLYVVFLITVVITWAGLASLRREVRQARYFLIAWSTMILGRMIFALKGWGWIPQDNLTILILILSAAAESILFSLALADRIRILRLEKETAMDLYKDADNSAKIHQMAFLQAQIKPHFLYNSLNVIATLCRLDPEKAHELILDLSSYLQHTFDFNNLSPFIPFDEELEFIQAYIRIEKARFREGFQVEYDLDNTDDLQLPPLIIQPLVENAIRHGIRKSEHNGTVVLRVRKKAEQFIIQVQDDGAGMSGDRLETILTGKCEPGAGIGIYNINQRLMEIYGKGLDINSRPGEGTIVTVVIPKK